MDFYNRAKLHQAKFRAEYLKLDRYDTHATMLTDEDALKGLNFCTDWPGMMEGVRSRYPNFRGPLYKNMLRSEHVPFNFFVPLQQKKESQFVKKFISTLFPNLEIDFILDVHIEITPETAEYLSKDVVSVLQKPVNQKYLDDNTSFDALITYAADDRLEAIGIEVKYTETSYPYGDTEWKRMFQLEDSLYHKTHHNSEIYLPDTIPLLREKGLKQLWRNHLLGLSMLEKGEVDRFTSVLLYPQGNLYQANAIERYKKALKDESQSSLLGLTYEEFISKGRYVFGNEQSWGDWLNYLHLRYVV